MKRPHRRDEGGLCSRGARARPEPDRRKRGDHRHSKSPGEPLAHLFPEELAVEAVAPVIPEEFESPPALFCKQTMHAASCPANPCDEQGRPQADQVGDGCDEEHHEAQ